MHQQLWGYKVEEALYLGVREQKMLNTTDVHYVDIYKSDSFKRCTSNFIFIASEHILKKELHERL
jgi:hypothetical protein